MQNEILLPYIIVFLVIIPIIIVYAQYRHHVFSGIRPTGVLLGVLLVFYYIDVVPFVYDFFPSRSQHGVLYLLVIIVMFAGVVAGIQLADKLIRPPTKNRLLIRYSNSYVALGNPILFGCIAILCSVIITYNIIYGPGIEAISEFAESEGEALRLQELRWQVNFGDPGPLAYLAAISRNAILPFLSLALVSLAIIRRSFWTIASAIVLWTIVAISRASILHKAPLSFWIVAPFIVLITRRGMLIKLRSILPAVGVFLLITSGLYTYIYGGTMSTGVDKSISRINFSPQYCLASYLMTFPDYHPYMYGSSISFVHYLQSKKPHVASYEYVADFANTPETTPNAVFVADGWADFGWLGVVLISIIVGLILRSGESILLKAPQIPLFHGTYVAFVMSTVYLSSGALPSILLTWGLGLGPIVVGIIWFFRPRQRSKIVMRDSTGVDRVGCYNTAKLSRHGA